MENRVQAENDDKSDVMKKDDAIPTNPTHFTLQLLWIQEILRKEWSIEFTFAYKVISRVSSRSSFCHAPSTTENFVDQRRAPIWPEREVKDPKVKTENCEGKIKSLLNR